MRFPAPFQLGPPSIMREETFASAVDVSYTPAGIRTSATTDWLPNAGIAPSSDRTAPGRMSRFLHPIEVLAKGSLL
jgi:hypothetical protein